MILAIFLLFISVFLESIIPNLIREFIPFFMIAAIIIISSFKIGDKKVYTTIFIFGVCYDLLYTNLIIFHGFLFISVKTIRCRQLKYYNGYMNFRIRKVCKEESL